MFISSKQRIFNSVKHTLTEVNKLAKEQDYLIPVGIVA